MTEEQRWTRRRFLVKLLFYHSFVNSTYIPKMICKAMSVLSFQSQIQFKNNFIIIQSQVRYPALFRAS